MIKDILEMLADQDRELLRLSMEAGHLRERSQRLRAIIEERVAQGERDLLVLRKYTEAA